MTLIFWYPLTLLDSESRQGLGKEQEEDASGDRVGQDPRVSNVDFLLLVPLSDESPGPVGDLRRVQLGARPGPQRCHEYVQRCVAVSPRWAVARSS